MEKDSNLSEMYCSNCECVLVLCSQLRWFEVFVPLRHARDSPLRKGNGFEGASRGISGINESKRKENFLNPERE